MRPYAIQPEIAVASLLDDEVLNLFSKKKILLISSPSLVATDKVKTFLSKLESRGELCKYTLIKPDAPLQDVEDIIVQFTKPDMIVAIGGGSVIDSAKALSLGWQGASITDFFYKKTNLPASKIQTIAIPTTAGSGAELSFGAILYDRENNIKNGLRGKILQTDFVILDVDLYLNASPKLIVETGFDCLTHAIETYLSKASSSIVRIQSVTAINTFFGYIEKAQAKDPEAMKKMAIASAFMGINLALSSTCLPHRLQYALRKMRSHSHAQGLICLYNGWLDVIGITESFENLANEFNLTSTSLVEKINSYKKRLDINYSLRDFGFTNDDLTITQNYVEGNLELDPAYKETATITEILKKSL